MKHGREISLRNNTTYNSNKFHPFKSGNQPYFYSVHTRNSSSSSNASSSSSSSDSPPMKIRTLDDIYADPLAQQYALYAYPVSFKEAAKRQECKQAMKEEMQAIERNQTWELVDLPNEKSPIGLKWLFRMKFNTYGGVQKHKVRLVAKGYLHTPTMHHLGAATTVLRYAVETTDFGIDDGKSISGHMFSLGSGGISWSSKKQEMVALSSGEAKYIVVTSAACQAVWLRRLLNDLHKEQQGSIIIFCDNTATIAMTKNPPFYNRTKHIDIRYHFIRTLTAKGEIMLKYCGTKEQVADVLTKSISIAQHAYLRKLLGVCSFESRGNVE
nr:retrovirus-related Pol polyprotein from transposon TNT 1-94 [Tanacetum cinerariifolium]